MNGRQHLILDALGQAGILLMFSFFIAKSDHPLEVAEILAILLFFWQIINALISYRYFERETKGLFVKVAAWSIIGICGGLGLLLLITQFPVIPASIVNAIIMVLEKGVPYIFAIFAIWCLIITINDLYNTVFNRI